jgi:hypothetical protein
MVNKRVLRLEITLVTRMAIAMAVMKVSQMEKEWAGGKGYGKDD